MGLRHGPMAQQVGLEALVRAGGDRPGDVARIEMDLPGDLGGRLRRLGTRCCARDRVGTHGSLEDAGEPVVEQCGEQPRHSEIFEVAVKMKQRQGHRLTVANGDRAGMRGTTRRPDYRRGRSGVSTTCPSSVHVRLGASSVVMLTQILGRGQLAEGLVWSDMVVGVFPAPEVAVDFGDSPGDLSFDELVELTAMGPVGALHVGVELWGVRRQQVEGQVKPLTGPFEEGFKLAAAVDLESFDGEGEPFQQRVEEALGGQGCGSAMHLEHVPSADDITCGELPEAITVDPAQLQSVELDQVTWSTWCGWPARAAFCPGPNNSSSSLWVADRRVDQHAAASQPGEDPTHCGLRASDALTAQQDDQLGLAPAGVQTTKRFDTVPQIRIPPGLARLVWAPGAMFQAGEVERVVA